MLPPSAKLAKKLKRKIALLEGTEEEEEEEEQRVFKKPLPINWRDAEENEEEDDDKDTRKKRAYSYGSTDNEFSVMSDAQKKRELEVLDILNNGNVKAVTSLACIGVSRANKILEYREGKTFQRVRNMFHNCNLQNSWRILKIWDSVTSCSLLSFKKTLKNACN